MKNRIFLFLILMTGWLTPSTAQDIFNRTDDFLKTYVSEGKVKYTAIKADATTLKTLIDRYENQDISGWEKNTQKAFYINAYNLMVIKELVKDYPTASPMDKPGFFDAIQHKIAGNKWTLDYFENKVLRVDYADPRLHFSLVCGALGCPVIRNEAYVPAQLESQLEDQTTKALNNPNFVYQKAEKQTVYLSEIFKWYQEDFGKNPKEAVAYINQYRTQNFDPSYKVAYYPYDWSINDFGNNLRTITSPDSPSTSPQDQEFNLQTFTAGSLLRKGQIDLTLFNTLYTQSKSNWMGTTFSGFRESFYTSLLQATFGVSKNKRLNIGFDVYLRASGKTSDSTASGIGTPLKFKNNDSTRFGVSLVGPRIKLAPFEGVNNFSIQSSFLIPTIQHPEGYTDASGAGNSLYFVDWDRYIWWNQFFYDKTFGDFQVFGAFEMLFRFKRRKEQTTAIDIPAKLFLSYFPTKKITVYAMTEHVPRFRYDPMLSSNDAITTPANYTASGLGFKYQFSKNLNLELLYTNFWRSQNAGLGNTFNIGIKYITN